MRAADRGWTISMEYRKDGEQLVWVRNPFTGSVTYFTHVHKKRSGFVRRAQDALLRGTPDDPRVYEAQLRRELEAAQRACPFCPGNEELSPDEIVRLEARDIPAARSGAGWIIRAVRNLIPRIPECCTGGRNESYVVVEDPRHFADDAQGHEDLLYTALLPAAQFQALLDTGVEVARRAYANPAVRSVLFRKNQGRGSGASQPHVHNQVIGCDMPFPVVEREAAVLAARPHLWKEILAFVRDHGFVLAEREGCVAYFCPFGVFPRSYEIVCPDDWVRVTELPADRWKAFGALLRQVLQILGPMPLDYEIHDGHGVPLHAHVNARHFAYSNIGGTLNLPSTIISQGKALPQRGQAW
jgi:galactose-1-phosphate uridylyltransferase